MAKNVAEVFIETLVKAGVKRVYGVSGDSLNGLTDTIRKNKQIEWLHVRHEEVAAFAAGAEAHLTGEIAVCAGSCGPAIFTSSMASSIAIGTGCRYSPLRRRSPATRWAAATFRKRILNTCLRIAATTANWFPSRTRCRRVLGIAMRTALTKRGVAVIVIPGDVALRECSANALSLGMEDSASVIFPSENELRKAAEILNNAQKVTILGGAGCDRAHAEAYCGGRAVEGARLFMRMRGKEFIEYDNPYDVGMTGLLGFSSGYHAMMNCDALLMLGTDFPYQQFYPGNAKIIQVDRLGEQIGRRTPVDLGLIGNVKDTLEVLTPLIESKTDRSYLDTCLGHYKNARKSLDDLATGEPGRTPIHPQYVARILDELAAQDAVFSCDVGTPTVWAARYLHMNGKRRLLGSFTHGSMANALPQAIGVQASHPGRQVITLSGDGGLAMLLGDLLTLRQLKLPVKVVVFNNGSLGFVELEMKAAGLVDYGTDLVNPNFAKLAESADIFGARVEKPEELRPALSNALAHDGPALVEVLVNRQELSMPPTISLDQALGFSLYMIRAVLSGRGDEVIDLAKTNLLR